MALMKVAFLPYGLTDRPVALEGFQWSYYWRELQHRVVEAED